MTAIVALAATNMSVGLNNTTQTNLSLKDIDAMAQIEVTITCNQTCYYGGACWAADCDGYCQFSGKMVDYCVC